MFYKKIIWVKNANNKSMKNFIKNFILFFLVFITLFCHSEALNGQSLAYNNGYKYEIVCGNKTHCFYRNDFNFKLSDCRKKNYHNIKIIDWLEYNNFSNEDIISYLFPEINEIVKKLEEIYNISEIEDSVIVKENKCKLDFISGQNGKCIDRKDFIEECFKQIKDNKKYIKINLKILDYTHRKKTKEMFVEKSCFSTQFHSSSEERKNNIRIALKALDGIIIEEGELFSFNEITGKRIKEMGYMPAKIISQGTFALGYGGGVCQVSTTLYNACLLSGLEIIEVNNHSLPVSYIEPSFDAMVNSGTSDLRVRNNTGGKIIITTSSENDVCKIKIFGIKNKYKITRQSEKISIIPAGQDIIDKDYKKYNYELEIGEEKRISYPKDGFISRAYLNFFDEQGNLVERRFIRENHYNATKGVIIKREN